MCLFVELDFFTGNRGLHHLPALTYFFTAQHIKYTLSSISILINGAKKLGR